jgi:hypothetical protein
VDDPTNTKLERAAAALRLAVIVTFYFSLCVLIILAVIGARP